VARPSPTLAGFRLAFTRPALGLAEIVWRWSIGAAACALLSVTLFEYLNTLAVSSLDLLLFRSRQPVLVGRALAHIFAGSGQRIISAVVVLLLALPAGWILSASAGRAATLKAMLSSWPRSAQKWRLRSLVGLNSLRFSSALAALLGLFGATMLAGLFSGDDNSRAALVWLIFLTVALLVGSAWSALNWFLSLASIFVVRDGRDTFAALGDAVLLCHDHFGAVSAVGFWFGLLHFVLFATATVASCFPLALATQFPKAVTWIAILTITLAYFAVVDYLYVARLAAYLAILENSDEPVAPARSTSVPSTPVSPARPMYDPDDLILSDIETAKGT